MNAIVFVGPSLPPPRELHPGIDFRPPAARGDVLAAAEAGARRIGLVDGVFATRLAVTVTELWEATRVGAIILGAASVGALRAVEAPDVVRGVGALYAALRDGALRDEDELGCTYQEGTFELVAWPLVRVREALTALSREHPEFGAHLHEVLGTLKALPFDARTPGAVVRAVRLAAPAMAPETVRRLLHDPAHDPKRRDALALVDEVVRGVR